MDIQELRRLRRELERTLEKSIWEAVEQFKQATGLCPTGINISFVGLNTIGKQEKEYVLKGVSVDIEI